MPEETVVLSSSFSTYVKSFANVKLGAAVLTDQRVMFFEGNDVLFNIPLDQIKSFAEGKHGWSKKIIIKTKEGLEYGFLPKKKHYDLWLQYLRNPQSIVAAAEESLRNKPVAQEAFIPPQAEATTAVNQAGAFNQPMTSPPTAVKEKVGTVGPSTPAVENTFWYLPGIQWVVKKSVYVGVVGACCWLFGKIYMWWIGQNIGGTLLFADWRAVAQAMAGMQGTIKVLYYLWHYGFWTMIWAFSIALAGSIAIPVIEAKQESPSRKSSQ
ncbi:hypothetical protein [Desulfoferula mesophila]|uniref:GRAM domain-containing protein n=1 Tax=Desulfoferula mesophila TaxID=3058419 RepID=A0AAU9EG81_9BACT|nr:hypothetical protein FAK_32540 [Desulfoferula mesophilus]